MTRPTFAKSLRMGILGSSFFVLLGGAVLAQDVKISTPKPEILTNEPFFLNLTAEIERKERPQFTVVLGNDDQVWTDPESSGQQRLIELGDDGRGRHKYTAAWVFHYDAAKGQAFFASPGKFRLRVHNKQSGKHSNQITVTVTEAADAAKVTGTCLIGRKAIIAAYTDVPSPEGEEDLRKVLSNGSSPYAPYSAYFCLRKEYKKLCNQGVQSREDQVERLTSLAGLAKKYELAEKIPAPSQWHSSTLLMLAHCRILGGDHTKAQIDITSGMECYPDGPVHASLKAILAELETARRRK